MTVWIVEDWVAHEGCTVVAAFDSLDKARAYVKKENPSYKMTADASLGQSDEWSNGDPHCCYFTLISGHEVL